MCLSQKRENIRTFHGCEVRIEKFVRGTLFGITRLCRVMPNRDPEGRIFLSAPNNHDRFFFLHTFRSPVFDFNVEAAIKESCSYTLTSATFKVGVICDVTMTSTPNVLTTELRDLLHNQCIGNTCCFLSILRVPVCKIIRIFNGCEVLIEKCPSDGIFNLHRRTIMDSFSCILFLRQLHLDSNMCCFIYFTLK